MYDMKNLTKLKKLGELAPEAFKGFMTFDDAAFRGGAIPLKYKELMAAAVSLTTQCPTASRSTRNRHGRLAPPSRSWPRRRWSPPRCGPAARSPTALTRWNDGPGVGPRSARRES